VARLDLAPTLAVFASRSVISTPPRFERDYSARATLAVFAETHRLRTSDAERDQGVSRKPSLHAIRESRIASSPRDKKVWLDCIPHSRPSDCPSISSRSPHFDSFAPAHSGIRPAHCVALGTASELVVLVFEQDVERGERSLTARDVLLQVELVRIAQFVARVHLLLENSQIIPNHDDFVKECLEPATAGKLISIEASCPQAA
jgi:hypothetical protein